MGIHDKTFKKLMSYPAMRQAFFQDFLPPAIKRQLKLETLQLRPCEIIEKNLQAYYTDLLFSCQMKDGEESLLFTLVEHQSQADEALPLRMIRYTCSILERYAKEQKSYKNLPVVFPLIFYTGRTQQNTDVNELFSYPHLAAQYTFQDAQLVATQSMTHRQLLQLSPNNLFFTSLFHRDKQGQRLFVKLLKQPQTESALIQQLSHLKCPEDLHNFVLYYICCLEPLKTKELINMYNEFLHEHLKDDFDLNEITNPYMREQVLNSRREGIQEGQQEGLKEGMLKGNLEAKADALLAMVENLNLSLEKAAEVIGASQEVI
jgi:predicted transposase/invertase (TIGR01784 family)